jgi:leucyl-tRNA synthetase
LRFADPWNSNEAVGPEAMERWLPADLYVGGAEHALMHLLYARFWTKVLADAGLLPFREPFPRLRSQGIVHAADGKRMSKSRGNVVTPDEVVERHGADALRIYLLFMAPFDRNVIWDEEGILGSKRFLHRAWRLCQAAGEPESDGAGSPEIEGEVALRRAMHKAIRRVTEDIEAFKFNTAVAAMMQFLNTLSGFREREGSSVFSPTFHEATGTLILLLAPFAPHIAEELWAHRGGDFSVHQQPWPAYDPDLAETASETITLVVQVNGKVRDRIDAPVGIDDDQSRRLALESRQVQRYLDGRPARRVIVVPGKLVSVVV